MGEPAVAERTTATRTVVEALWNRHFVPRPLRDADEWAEAELVLPTEETEDAGQFRLSRAPYAAFVLKLLSPRSLTRIVSFQAPAQVTKTLVGLIVAFHRIVDHPCRIWFVFPTDLMARDFKRDRFDPLVEASPSLRALIPKQKAREGGHTKTFLKVPGGSVKFVGANVPWALRSTPVKLLIEEEYDALSRALKGEGSASGIAEARTRRVRRAKIYRNSTPTIAGVSAIVTAVQESESCYEYQVPCPHCDVRQVLRWEQMRYEKPPTPEHGTLLSVPGVTVACVACERPIEERHKPALRARGEWVAKWNLGSKSVGVDGSSLALLAERPWGEMVAKYLRGLGDEQTMREFWNLDLGLPYEQDTSAPDVDLLLARREPYQPGVVPRGARFLTCGVDWQDGWIKSAVWAWGRNGESWSIDVRVLVGPTNDPAAGAALAWRQQVLDVDWPCEGGGTLPITLAGIDSGYRPDDVYALVAQCKQLRFAKHHFGVAGPRTVMATKGRDEWVRPVSIAQKVDVGAGARTKRGTPRVVMLGTSLLRLWTYDALKVQPLSPEDTAAHGPPKHLCHFPQHEAWNATELAELTNATLTRTTVRGVTKLRWDKPKHLRHELGDCFVNARAAAIVVGLTRWRESDWQRLERGLPPGLLAAPPVVTVAPPSATTADGNGAASAVGASPPSAPPPPAAPAPPAPRAQGPRYGGSSWMGRFRG